MIMIKNNFSLRLKCIKCNYKWVRRTDKLPKRCPNCQTKYWRKEKHARS